MDPAKTVQVISGWDWHIALHRTNLLKNKWTGGTWLIFTSLFHLILCTELSWDYTTQYHSTTSASSTILDWEIQWLGLWHEPQKNAKCLTMNLFTAASGIHSVAITTDSIQWADVATLHLLLFTDCDIQQKPGKAHYSHLTLAFPDVRTAPIA